MAERRDRRHGTQGCGGDHLPQGSGGSRDEVARLTEEYREKFANPFIAGHRGYIDDVIMPRNTRKRICRSLAMLRNKELKNPWRRHGNIPL